MLAWKQSILVAIQKPVSFSSIKLLSTSKSSCQTTVQSNYYEILDVPKSATQKEIREAYIKKSKEVRMLSCLSILTPSLLYRMTRILYL